MILLIFFPLPFVIAPWLLWLLGGIAVTVIGTLVFSSAEKTEGTKIAVLGMQGAGKTTFLDVLRGKDVTREYTPTGSTDRYQDFYINLNDRNVHICGGDDIAGGEYIIKSSYEKYIKNNDIIFFLFNADDYLRDKEIRKMVDARLDFIYRKAIESNKVNIDKNFVVFATHSDLIESKRTIITDILKMMNGKEFIKMLQMNFFALDSRNKNDVFEIVKNIF